MSQVISPRTLWNAAYAGVSTRQLERLIRLAHRVKGRTGCPPDHALYCMLVGRLQYRANMFHININRVVRAMTREMQWKHVYVEYACHRDGSHGRP
jgi:hypothetical protein